MYTEQFHCIHTIDVADNIFESVISSETSFFIGTCFTGFLSVSTGVAVSESTRSTSIGSFFTNKSILKENISFEKSTLNANNINPHDCNRRLFSA